MKVTAAPVLLLVTLMNIACSHPQQSPAVPAASPGRPLLLSAPPVPSLTPYLPPAGKATGAAVIVCPGGGYGALMDTYEGADVCRWLNDHGVAAFLLRYRVAPNRHPAPLTDARDAIRLVRARAEEFGVDPSKVGILGFSAGGHLAGSAAALGGSPDVRPDFAILVYPVISFLPPYGHFGSRDNLLGRLPNDAPLNRELSLETRVTGDTPPCFVVHGRNDKIVPYQNSELLAAALKSHGVPHDLLLLDNGPHGFGLNTPDPAVQPWTDRCLDFLRTIDVLPAAAK